MEKVLFRQRIRGRLTDLLEELESWNDVACNSQAHQDVKEAQTIGIQHLQENANLIWLGK